MKRAIYCLAIFAIFWRIASIGALAGEYKLPDTGQHTCYDGYGNVISCPSPGEPFYGQDAQYEGPQPAYQDNGDGTVTDLNTGLMWQQSDNGTVREWQEACNYCDGLTLAGHSDWRIPDRRELVSIVDYGRYYPVINPVFDCNSYHYWSGSTYAFKPDGRGGGQRWRVSFDYGYVTDYHEGYRYYVRCVRGGP